MQEGEGQRAHQERGHSPEGPEQPGIAIAVMMCRVGQVAGKLTVRTIVALAAGFDDVVPAERRTGLRRRQDVVDAVAVVALGDAFAAQSRNLAVKRVEEGFGLVLVTPAALLHYLGTEARLVDA